MNSVMYEVCLLQVSETHKKLNKDRFRRDISNVEGAYKEFLSRLVVNEL